MNELENFLTYCIEHRYFKPRTVETYRTVLTRFFVDIDKPAADVSTGDITRFVAGLAADGRAINTRRLYQSAIRMFFFWHAQRSGAGNPGADIAPIREEHPIPDILTPGDVSRMILFHSPVDLIGRRNGAIIALMAGTGLRISEIARLNFGSIQVRENSFIVNVAPSKTKRGRMVPFGKFAETDLVAETFASYYLELKMIEGFRDANPLFLTMGIRRSGTRLQTEGIRRMIERTARHCRISGNITPHSFRHFFGTLFIANGGDLLDLRELLGHALVETTMRYVHLANLVSAKAIDKYGTTGLIAPKSATGYVRIIKQFAEQQRQKRSHG